MKASFLVGFCVVVFILHVVSANSHSFHHHAPCGPNNDNNEQINDNNNENNNSAYYYQTSNFGCIDQPIDICIALDMSGSVCNKDDSLSSLCTNCNDDYCHHDVALDNNICCNNVAEMIQFTKALATTLNHNIQSQTKFSLVTFGTQATTITFSSSSSSSSSPHSLVDASTFVEQIMNNNNLKYSGGWRNTGDAIQQCHGILKNQSLSPTSQKIIMVVTNGIPTNGSPNVPPGTNDNRHVDYALQQATNAKQNNDDIMILPILIDSSSSSSSLSPNQDFISKLASNPFMSTTTKTTIVDYTHLNNQLDDIAFRVACQEEEPQTTTTNGDDTCSNNPIHVCVSLDMSGVVCTPPNSDIPRACSQCSSTCKEEGYSWEQCCTNFYNSMKFAKDLVTQLHHDVENSKFSLVSFATDATMNMELDTQTSFCNAIDELVYTGGWTNTGDSIKECTTTLQQRQDVAERIIILITNGTPTNSPTKSTGYFIEHKDYTYTQAQHAKQLGITILPIVMDTMVSNDNDFLASLGTNPSSTTVTTFDTIDSELDSIVEMVVCA